MGCRQSKWCYSGGCREEVCRIKHREYERERRRIRERPDSEYINPFIDPQEAREHLLFLKSKGVGCRQLSQLTGITPQTLYNIRVGRRTKIKRKIANTILGVGMHQIRTTYPGKIARMEKEWEKRRESVSVEVQAM